MLPAAKGICRFSWLVSVSNVTTPLSLTASWCSSSHGNVSAQSRSIPIPSSSLDNFLPPPDISQWERDPQAAAKSLANALSPTHRTVLAAALVTFHQRDGPDAKAHADRLFTAADAGTGDSQLSRAEFGMALKTHESLTGHSSSTELPTARALSLLFLSSAIPFVVFGFLDNFIMLMAGEEIDARIGTRLGITMIASAGLGNTLADVIGVGVSTSIENTVRRIPFLRDSPKLSQHQLASKRAKIVKTLGACSGVAVGCVLGLTPLLLNGHFFQSL